MAQSQLALSRENLGDNAGGRKYGTDQFRLLHAIVFQHAAEHVNTEIVGAV
jgi:hypothetical protein